MALEPIGTHTTTLHYHFLNGITVEASDRPPIQLGDGTALGVPEPAIYAVPGMSMVGGGKAPDTEILRDDIALKAYRGTGSANKTESAHFQMIMPPDYLVGQVPEFVIYWTHNVAFPTGSVRWWLDVTVANGTGDGSFEAPETLTIVQATSPQYTNHITAEGGLVLSQAFADELGPESIILGRIYRNPAAAGDTFTSDAFLSFLGLHYERGGGVA